MPETKVVLDTNILVSSLLEPQSRIGLLWQDFKKGRFILIMSRELYQEVDRKLEEFRKKGRVKKTAVRTTLNYIRKIAVFVELKEIPKITRDPKDDIVIATAVVAKADFLITGDRDILALGKSYKKVKIRKPVDFPA